MRRLALIAHDNKKVDLIAWATFNRDTLARFHIVATRHTARLVRDKIGLDVEEVRRSRTTPTSARCFACATSTTSRWRRISRRPTS